MTLTETSIKDLVILEPKVFGDHRGYFMETFQDAWFRKNVCDTTFVQDNESRSSHGVLRGLHFQKGEYAQAKLVRCIEGEVLDVAVDLRKDSPTFGQYETVLLSAENKKQFFVPRGFAHGFVVLSETAIFSYKVDNDYAPEHDSGILWSDTELNIDWIIKTEDLKLSDKDKVLQTLAEYKSTL